jgi:hypothetical protein
VIGGGARRIVRIGRRRIAERRSRRTSRTLDPTFVHDTLGGTFRIRIVTDRPDYFGPYADALARELKELGAQPSVHHVLDDELPDGEAVIVIGLHRFAPDRLRTLGLTSVVAAIQTEQLATPLQGAPRFGSRRIANVLSALPHVDLTLDWSRENATLLREHHPAVGVVPYGFIEADLYPRRDPVTPTYDLAFLGNVDALDGRRRRILQQLGDRFHIHPNINDAWGADKFAVFRQARIVLNLHVEASAVFESPRFYDVLGAGLPLLSEAVHDPWPFRAGADFEVTSILRLERDIQNLLDDEPLRQRLAATGRRTALANGLDVTAGRLLEVLLVTHQRLTLPAR